MYSLLCRLAPCTSTFCRVTCQFDIPFLANDALLQANDGRMFNDCEVLFNDCEVLINNVQMSM